MPRRPAASSKRKADDGDDGCHSHGEDDDVEQPRPAASKKRKTAAAATGADMPPPPLAERTAVASLKKAMHIGAHVSSAGGLHNSVQNARAVGANAFALFLKSQRRWVNPPLAADAAARFRDAALAGGYDAAAHVLPHGSYLVNLAQPDGDKAKQAYGAFVDDLERCAQLGIRLYNFHPGSAGTSQKPDAVRRIAAQLNRAHAATAGSAVVTVLENMAGSGTVVGSTFEDLRDIIALIDDKSRVGVCLDTCHTFAAGYDLRTPDAFRDTMQKFEDVVGRKYLMALHLNDSKAPFASNRDVHANIGTGFLGLRAFHNIMNHDGFAGLPIVLETPIDRKGLDGKRFEDHQVWADEIKLLEGLIGADPDSDDFCLRESTLRAKGAVERAKFQDQADRKSAKGSKAAKSANGKLKWGKKKADTDDEASS